MQEGITVILIFLGLSTPLIIIGLIYYIKKRLEHKQIMAAIEKGTPLSELRPPTPATPNWIRSISVGIAFLIFSLPFLYMFLELFIRRSYFTEKNLMPFAVFFAIGFAFFIRGLLLRKAQRQIQPPDKISAGEDKSRDIGG